MYLLMYIKGNSDFYTLVQWKPRKFILKHDNNFKTTYGYLHTISTLVKLGKNIKKGDVIAQVGGSESDKGPHLYFEIRNGDVIIDPRELIINYKENDVSIR